MSRSYIPRGDAQFSYWTGEFTTTVETDRAGYGLSAEELTELQNLKNKWDAKFDDLQHKRAAAKAATYEKDKARREYESYVRKLSQKIQYDPSVSEGQKLNAGLPVHSKTSTPVARPRTAPIATIDSFNIREHVIRFSDSTSPHTPCSTRRRLRNRNLVALRRQSASGRQSISNVCDVDADERDCCLQQRTGRQNRLLPLPLFQHSRPNRSLEYGLHVDYLEIVVDVLATFRIWRSQIDDSLPVKILRQ